MKNSGPSLLDRFQLFLQTTFKYRRPKSIIPIVFLLLLITGVTLTIYQIQRQQENRGRAEVFGVLEAEQGSISDPSAIRKLSGENASNNEFVQFDAVGTTNPTTSPTKSAPSEPTISTVSCLTGGTWTGRISWTGTANPTFGFYVDMSQTPAFTTYMHKTVSSGTSTDTSGFGPAPYGGNITFPVVAEQTYYFRVYNEYPTVTDHGPTASFTIPRCLAPTPTRPAFATPTPTTPPTPTIPVGGNSQIIEGESMSLPDQNGQVVTNDAEASGRSHLLIWSHGPARATYAGSINKIILRVKADLCFGEPHMVVKVDGRTIPGLSTYISSTNYVDLSSDDLSSFSFGNSSHNVEVSYDSNDFTAIGCDRNIRLDKISIQAQTSQGPPPTPITQTSGDGLLATYFNENNLTKTAITKIDSTLNFDWGAGSPTPRSPIPTNDPTYVDKDTFSIVWTGFVVPQYTQEYTFYARSDDGVRLWVNNQQLVNQWKNQSAREYAGRIRLTAGQRYPIKVEYYENYGDATIKLSWSSSFQSKQIIPKSRLYSADVLGIQANAQSSCPVQIPANSPSITLSSPLIHTGGTYMFWTRMKASQNEPVNNSFYLTIDDQCPTVVGGLTPSDLISSNEWTWVNRTNNAEPITYQFADNSSHIIRLFPRQLGVKVDKIIITKDTSCIPNGFGENCQVDTTPSPTPTPYILPSLTPTPTRPAAATPTPLPSGNGFRVQGNKILDPQGRDWLMRGMAYPSQEWSCFGEGRGNGIGEADIQTIATDWRSNTVRFAITAARWYGRKECTAAEYRNKLDEVINFANNAGMVAIIDHHGRNDNDEQVCMANNEMLSMWKEIAQKYKGNSRVFFELFNEPRDVSWNVWRNGGQITCGNQNEQGVGMQQLADAIRAEGANNILVVGGLNWGYDLGEINKGGNYKLNGSNIAYSTHPYDFEGKQPSNWENDYGYLTPTFPVVATEFGPIYATWVSNPECDVQYLRDILGYFDNKNIGYTGWGWHGSNGGDDCGFPSLIRDWNGTPNVRGQLVKDNIANYRNRIGY